MRNNDSHLREGTLLQGGRYRIVRFIGSGGFGCTYEAVHTVMEERVAVKELFARDFCYRDGNTSQVSVATESKKELFSKLRRKFIEEAKALYRLRHPGIVRVSDVFEENGTAYYVMDYIDGKSLQDLLKHYGRLPESEALGYIRQVSEALRYVHGHNRLHLDIKPGNIMVDGSGSAVLIDFGMYSLEVIMFDHDVVDDPELSWPEVDGYKPLEHMGGSFTPSTDIYALGATLYNLLTGKTPLSAARLISGEYMAPLPVEISPSTRSAVESAMVLDNRFRPQSVGEFLRLLGQESVTDSPGRKGEMRNNDSHLREGTLLQGGRYRIVRFIGSGGFGCTYEAEHTVLGVRVAVKEFFVRDFCNRDGSTSRVSVATESKKELVGKLLRKFVDEARALYMLKHPGIVRVSDVFEENGTAYYVMDYIAGKSLQDLLKQYGRLPESEALGYIRQVSEALRYVHGHNRLHLDIKPGNIMVDGSGSAVLIDFGASKQYDEVNGENTSTLLGHTPGYAPPEQMCNSVRQFTPSTDIYALGATLYKLLTGETPVESALRISGEDMAPLPVGISPSTRSAVESAMVLDKRSRPQSVGEFLRILGQGTVTDSPGRKCHTVYDTYEDTEFDETEHDKTIDPSSTSGSGRLHGYAWVDLGLSVRWATCNVGASSPSDYGNYYAWGETTTKSSYTEGNSRTRGVSPGDISGSTRYDAATANWGSGWRMPTKAELEELVDKCDWQWMTQGGHNGYKVTGPNGNSIFLPAAGWRYGTSLSDAGGYGSYWCSTPDGSGTLGAYGLYFSSGDHLVGWLYRKYGQSVRPVTDK